MKSTSYMNFPQPNLSVVETVGGFFRVEIHGPDMLRCNAVYAAMDIGRGPTKEEAIKQAREWLAGMKDRTAQGGGS